MGKVYPVSTIAQMAAIPQEARPRFLAEFPELLERAARAIAISGALSDDFELVSFEPEWIDDGARNVTVNVEMQDADGASILNTTITQANPAPEPPDNPNV